MLWTIVCAFHHHIPKSATADEPNVQSYPDHYCSDDSDLSKTDDIQIIPAKQRKAQIISS